MKSNIFFNIERNIKFLDNSPKFYLYWAILSVVILGFFGIFPLGKVLISKINTLQELKKINVELEQKVKDLVTARNQLEDLNAYTPYLDAYLPKKIILQNYMIDFVSAASSSGFFVQRFNPQKETKEGLLVNITLEGDGDTYDLIREIESLGRVTRISNITVTNVKDRQQVVLEVLIFKSEL